MINIQKIQLLVLLAAMAIMPGLRASNVQVTNISQHNVDADNHRISFDLQWDNSWRVDNQEPNNYDGVWVFIKFRDCLDKAGGSPGDYSHCWISTTVGDHTIDASTVDGSSMALDTELGLTSVGGTDRGMGLFIYQPAGDRTGTVIADSVSILWKSGLQGENSTLNSFDIQVVAIEMVYVPTSPFYLGDGTSNYYFRNPTDGNKPIYVDQAAMDFEAAAGGLYQLTPGSATPNVSNTFPNGYDGFWTMKYEISQEQYMQFLNTLSRTTQNYRIATNVTAATSNVSNVYVMSDNASRQDRNAIVCEPIVPVGGEPLVFHMDYNGNRVYNEADDGASIACNYLSAHDIMAYLDWAALRPITEFEFEKMGRGPYKSSYGYTDQKAWGTVEVTEVTGIANPGTATEAPTNSGDGICVFNDNSSVGGPMRCGFASDAATPDRYSCGASYYGIFELSGNVQEPYWGLWNNTTSDDNFSGESGDGILNETGDANETTWPQGADGSGTTSTFMYYRGGDLQSTNPDELNISFRDGWGPTTQRYSYTGGRGGRYSDR